MKKTKSMRTAFVRISSKNETNKGLVEYNLECIKNLFKTWSDSCKMTYFIIEHEADETVTTSHFHIVIRFENPVPFEVIKNKIPFGNIESAKNVKACVQYLIHQNDASKKQYTWDKIITNCDNMLPYQVQSEQKNEIDLQEIIQKIDNGEIREYNQYECIPISIWSKYKSRIENSLIYYRERLNMDKNRQINVVFLSGDTGTGKTTFAKKYCEKLNKSYCITSSSNDSMQDYKGQDVLIMDDLRDSDFSFTDLLKLLDNHTKSSIKSRFHNKSFIGDTIIITSYRPLSDWYFNISSENKHQLYRRIVQQYQFTDTDIKCYQYNLNLLRYEYIGTTKNIVTAEIKEQSKKDNLLEQMGLKFEKSEKKDNDWYQGVLWDENE